MSGIKDKIKGCDLCTESSGKPEELFLHGRCHMTAPVQVSIIEDVLIVRCYVPECGREIVKFRVVEL
jgi:hypothetical protein